MTRLRSAITAFLREMSRQPSPRRHYRAQRRTEAERKAFADTTAKLRPVSVDELAYNAVADALFSGGEG